MKKNKKNRNWQKNLLFQEYKVVWEGKFYKKKDFYKMSLEGG